MKLRWGVSLVWVACGGTPLSSSADVEGFSDDEVAAARASINGVVVIDSDSCTDFERFQIDMAMQEALDGPNGVNSLEIKACLKEGIMSTEPFASPEQITSALKQNMPTKIKCVDDSKVQCGSLTSWDGCAGTETDDESLSLSKKMLNDPTQSLHYIASVILHEVVHNKGFYHMDGLEYGYSVNLNVMDCFNKNQPWLKSTPASLSFRRSQMPAETELAHVGFGGGFPFRRTCTQDLFVRGLNGTAGGSDPATVNSLGVTCGADPLKTSGLLGYVYPLIGGTESGSAFSSSCAANEIATGIWGKAGDFVDKIGARCSTYADVKSGVTTKPRSLPLAGGPGGVWFTRDCPKGMAIREIRGRAALRIDQVRIVCASVAQVLAGSLPAPYSDVAPTFGTTGSEEREMKIAHEMKKVRTDYDYTCIGNSAMVGLYGRAGWEIDRLGGVCAKRLSGTTVGLDTIAPKKHIIPATTGWGGSVFEDYCPSGMALRGATIRVREKARIGQLAGNCVNAAKWLNPSVAATSLTSSDTATLPARGGSVATDQVATFKCDKGKLLYGFMTWSKSQPFDTFSVHGLRPICR
ncbi:MAG: hypothetical protein HYY84_01405 [Deltaproteobacteria bacterium]|nr:hypothetical protein [Deltaproteobacteria bacterium]